MKRRYRVSLSLLLAVAGLSVGCGSSGDSTDEGAGGSGGSGGGAGADAGDAADDGEAGVPFTSPVDSVALDQTIEGKSLSAPVDVVRDEWGVPHIYGKTLSDVAYAQGWLMAHDRLPQMDLMRHNADGTLGELVGSLFPQAIDTDIGMRMHHMRATAQKAFDELEASTDPKDQEIVRALGQFSAGVNAFIVALRKGQYALPSALAFTYSAQATKDWTEVDSLMLGSLQAFFLSFDASSEIGRTELDAKAKLVFDQASDPKLKARAGLGADLQRLAPIDPTHTINGWTGLNGDTSTASVELPGAGNLFALLEADHATVRDMGNDHTLHPTRGSNNWVVGPSLSTTGNPLVANDTHLSLSNPATFWLAHLRAEGGAVPVDVMGAAFPGIPGVILGMNQHLAWGATVNNIDVTDVYAETIVTCDDGVSPCVSFQGGKVALVPRVEKFDVGLFGSINKTLSITYYDVPHHGPIIPRPLATHDGVEALGTSELSVRWTGHAGGQLARAEIGLDAAASVAEAKAALDRDFKYGGQNWVMADDQGHFGWTETIRVPRRAAGSVPWKVMPGDGTAEWGTDLDPKYVPHAWDPAKGYVATANNDPIGVTDDGEPFATEPVVDGAPLYLGADYDPGTRVGRITKRLDAATSGGKKVGLDDMQAIQADAVSEYAELLGPTLVDAAQKLAEELATPGRHADLTAIAAGASATAKALVPTASTLVAGWATHDTPSGAAEDSPSGDDVAASQATLIFSMWTSQFAELALGDEITALGRGGNREKLLVQAVVDPTKLASGISSTTGDAVVFDDLATADVESKRQIAASALVAALDALATRLGDDATKWRWGDVHTLALEFLSPVDALRVPLKTDPKYPNGFPRHGANGTVDVANFGLSTSDFTYSEGPAIRFVCEVTPTGPKARNALPGGEVFDPASPHYADQMELWRKNKTFDLAFQAADVVASANKEKAARSIGRWRFTP